MLVEAIKQCDVIPDGDGPRAARKRAMFPGIRYDFPEEAVVSLIASGHVVAVQAASSLPGAVKATGKPQGRGS